MGDLSKNFSKRELACTDGCGFDTPKPALVETLQTIRDAVGKSVLIESGCRCAKRNAAVKGAANSAHLTGEAADIYVVGWSNRKLGDLVKSLYANGKLPHLQYCYLIVGNSRTRVHIGVDMRPRSRVFAF